MITITLDAVVEVGSVKLAIEQFAIDSDLYASGEIGPTFATSGPGSGWCKEFNTSDYARRALDGEYGALYYIDSDDGRVASLDDGEVVWTEDSEVWLQCPTPEEALESPHSTLQMAEAMSFYSGDMEEWKKLIELFQEVGELFRGIKI